MHRNAMNQLILWKERDNRKPLILQGARQVGKTWLVKEFGAQCFKDVAYVSFQDNAGLQAIFEGSLTPDRLLDAVSLDSGVSAGDSDTLVIFDEVQECPRALSSLKAFCELRPEIPLIAAGSLLGVALHRGVSFPVGKVEHMQLYPLTFQEFLMAEGEGSFANLISQANFDLMDAFSEKMTDALKRYYYVGGMPEAVNTFVKTKDYREVRRVHEQLLYGYEYDFSKYAEGVEAQRMRMIWHSIPSQLARENKRFIYSAVREGARARNLEDAISWLIDAGLILKVPRISKPGLPLSAYEDLKIFKLFVLDVGLLGAASRLDASTILEGSALFSEFKGALTEQFVCQQLFASGEVVPYYWSAENSSGEVDFVYEYAGKIYPLEVKANQNVRARSLRAFVDKYEVPQALRLSLARYEQQDWMTNVPLYAANALPRCNVN